MKGQPCVNFLWILILHYFIKVTTIKGNTSTFYLLNLLKYVIKGQPQYDTYTSISLQVLINWYPRLNSVILRKCLEDASFSNQYAMHTEKVNKTIKMLGWWSHMIIITFVQFFLIQKLTSVCQQYVGKLRW